MSLPKAHADRRPFPHTHAKSALPFIVLTFPHAHMRRVRSDRQAISGAYLRHLGTRAIGQLTSCCHALVPANAYLLE